MHFGQCLFSCGLVVFIVAFVILSIYMTRPWANLSINCFKPHKDDYKHKGAIDPETSAVIERHGSSSISLDPFDQGPQAPLENTDSDTDGDDVALEDHLKMMGLDSHEEATTHNEPARERKIPRGATWPCCGPLSNPLGNAMEVVSDCAPVEADQHDQMV